MVEFLSTLDNLKTAEMIVASGELSGVAIPPALTPSAGPHAVAGAVWAKVFSIDNAGVVALGDVATKTLDVASLPPRTLLKSVLLLVTLGTTSGVTSLTLDIGYTDPTYGDYLTGHDLVNDQTGTVKTTANSVASDAVPFNAIPSLTATTPIKLILSTPTGAEKLKDVLTCGFDIYFETLVLP